MIEDNNYLHKITDADLKVLLKELAERKLIEFVRQSWHVLEPDTPFVDGWHLHAICEHLEAVFEGKISRLLINIPPRHMKLLADNTVVPTPTGIKKHGDLKVGDLVFSPSGKPVKVIKVSAKALADHEITFTNGETIKCNGDHLWTVYDKWAFKWKTVDTTYLFNARKSKTENRFAIPDCKTLQFPARKLPLHPYVLGCWLGDGSSSKICITHDIKKGKHIDKIVSLGYGISAVCKGSKPTTVSTYFSRNISIEKFKKLNLYKNKHIPEVYLTSSKSQRLELLAGLIDTDGCVGKKSGRVRIITIKPEFAKQVLRLVSSLGFNGYINRLKAPGYENYKPSHKFVYHVAFQPTTKIPTVKKIISRIETPHRLRAIKLIKKSKNPETGNCITIGSLDGLYIVGEKNIVTHNSLAVSVFFPCWIWTKKPEKRMLFSSYSSDLSERDGDKCTTLINSSWYKENWGDTFSLIKETSNKIENSKMGYRISTSVGGMTTGEGGDLIVVDDPHNAKEISSEIKRLAVLRWWDEAMSTRLNNQRTGAKIIVMQRLHEKDLSGHVLAKDESYVHLCLPARYEMNAERTRTPLEFKDPRSKEGEILWPDKITDEDLKRLESDLGEYARAGQLQQRPSPRGGGLFKVKNFVRKSNVDFDEVKSAVRYWDKAGTADGGCFTCGVLMFLMKDGSFFVYDIVADQWNATDREKYIVATVKKDTYHAKAKKYKYCSWTEQEPGSSGKESAQATIKRLAGYRMYADRVTGDKESRATDFAVQVEARNVYVLDSDWIDMYFTRMEFYPLGEYKDWGDASSGAFNKLVNAKLAGTWGKRNDEKQTKIAKAVCVA